MSLNDYIKKCQARDKKESEVRESNFFCKCQKMGLIPVYNSPDKISFCDFSREKINDKYQSISYVFGMLDIQNGEFSDETIEALQQIINEG